MYLTNQQLFTEIKFMPIT
uniref:Uncharacterized protein n=1 Tax=Arundo donax TaxID=35708 RepID=A0A0A8YLJ2_ARUDO